MIKTKIDFTNPFIVRRWLRMLETDDEIAYLIKPNISFSKREIGFSINSNRFGLRGPATADAKNVIIGTSFGMGFGVDIGKNWYELDLDTRNWFNAALPVGPREWCAILNRFYKGNFEHALFVYHPNVLQHGSAYLRWRDSGRNIFDFWGWRTSFTGCAKIKLKNAIYGRFKENKGLIINLKNGVENYRINSTYVRLNHADFLLLDQVYDDLFRLISRFKRVTVVRVRIKEEEVPQEAQTPVLQRTLEQYGHIWEMTRSVIEKHGSITIHEAPFMGLESYNPYDTHWNATGNQRFANYLKATFNNFE